MTKPALLLLSLMILTLSCKPDNSIYLPVLETAFVIDITENSARSGGNITSDGGRKSLQKVYVGILQEIPQYRMILPMKVRDQVVLPVYHRPRWRE